MKRPEKQKNILKLSDILLACMLEMRACVRQSNLDTVGHEELFHWGRRAVRSFVVGAAKRQLRLFVVTCATTD